MLHLADGHGKYPYEELRSLDFQVHIDVAALLSMRIGLQPLDIVLMSKSISRLKINNMHK